MRVDYGRSVHGEEEIAAVVAVLRGSTRMGRSVAELERRIAALFAKPHGIMVNSGSSANELAIELLDLPRGSEVLTPALTFGTTVAPIVRQGHVPVFVDAEEGTYNVDADRLEAMIGPATRAMMVPSLAGNLPDWDRLRAIADRHGLSVVEDSADTLGATLHGRSTGARSDISTTSFYGSHVINAAGGGGMLCVADERLARRAKLLRSWGRSSALEDEDEAIERRLDVTVDGIAFDRKFLFEAIGHNFEPSELGAAFALVQLDRLDDNLARRAANFALHQLFFAAFADLLVLPRVIEGASSGWLAYPLTVRDDAPFSRHELQIAFERAGVQTRPVFAGNILRHPMMAGVPRRECAGGYPVADQVMRGGVMIGCHHGLGPAEIDHVHDVFATFVRARSAAVPA